MQLTSAADCSSQGNTTVCNQVSGCEWYNNQCVCAVTSNMDFIFAIDVSGLIGYQSFQHEKQFLFNFVQSGLNIDFSRIGWTIFSTNVNISDIYKLTEEKGQSPFIVSEGSARAD